MVDGYAIALAALMLAAETTPRGRPAARSASPPSEPTRARPPATAFMARFHVAALVAAGVFSAAAIAAIGLVP